jgi:hypothetical protein
VANTLTETPWVDWTGGDCPVAKSAMVQAYMLGDKLTDTPRGAYDPCPARDLEWGRPFTGTALGDIIAYRVVQA